MAAKRTDINIDQLVADYLAGKSVLQLSRKHNIARRSIDERLHAAGVRTRTRHEAQALKCSLMTPEQRQAQAAAAHRAVRGRRADFDELCRRALARERAQSHVSATEATLADMLRARGVQPFPQKAIGPYNCDLACDPVAVEVWGGQWHSHGKRASRLPKRTRYLLDNGWHMLAVVVGQVSPLTDATADYVAAYVKAARRNPAAIREYRVVRRAGEFIAGGTADDDEISFVPAFTSSRDPESGRYITVPR